MDIVIKPPMPLTARQRHHKMIWKRGTNLKAAAKKSSAFCCWQSQLQKSAFREEPTIAVVDPGGSGDATLDENRSNLRYI